MRIKGGPFLPANEEEKGGGRKGGECFFSLLAVRGERTALAEREGEDIFFFHRGGRGKDTGKKGLHDGKSKDGGEKKKRTFLSFCRWRKRGEEPKLNVVKYDAMERKGRKQRKIFIIW